MPKIKRAASVLRTEHFTTLTRDTTNRLVLNYTGQVPDHRIDAAFVDQTDCQAGYFGCGHHYIIKLDGTVEIGRDPLIRSSRTTARRLHRSAVFIGVVGGLAADTGYRADTVTSKQEASIEWLMQSLADVFAVPLEVNDHLKTWAHSRATASGDALKSRDSDFLHLLYAEMTDEEIAAHPDRIRA